MTASERRSLVRWNFGRLDRRTLLVRGTALGLALLPLGRARLSAQEATPPTSTGVDTLFTVAFAAEELPQADIESIFYRLTLDPDVALPVPAGPFCGCGGQVIAPGVGVETVVSGTYAVASGAPIRVRRAGASAEEEIAAGQEVLLEPRDVVVYNNYAAAGQFRNAGSGELVVLGVALVAEDLSDGTEAPDLPEGAVPDQLGRAVPYDWQVLAGGPVVATLRRVTLAPGEALDPVGVPGLESIAVESGEIELGIIPAGESAPTSSPMRYMAGRTTPFMGLGEGSRRVLTNSGAEPAVVLILAIDPAGYGATPTS